MTLSRKLLLVNMILILVSITAHEVASESYTFLALTLAVCIVKWRMDRHEKPFRLEPSVADIICGIAFVIMFVRSFSVTAYATVRVPDIRVPVMGQFLIILQWVYLFRRKRPRDYVWVYLVSIVHMGSAGLMMPGVGYAFFFVLYVICGMSALYVYNAWWTQGRAISASTDPKFKVHPRFFVLALVATALLLLPLAGIFMVLPRRRSLLRLNAPMRGLTVQPISGFSPRVRLGTIGTIQDNPERVMRLTVHDAETNKLIRRDSILLRGVALDTYRPAGEDDWMWSCRAEDTDWASGSARGGESNLTSAYRANFPGFSSGEYNRIRCDITLEPLHRSILFAPFAPESIVLPYYRKLWFHPLTHVMRYARRVRGQLDYSVTSRDFTMQSQPSFQASSNRRPQNLDFFLQLPQDISPRIGALARNLAPDANYPDDFAKAMRLLAFLSDERQFSYTLNMPPTRGVEPVENFLFNAKEGHCEYFASAMALMLREVGIPSRVVNGFKVTEWNPLGGHYSVRQSDAHSWVEAYLEPYGWRTLDPGVMRETAVPRPRFAKRWWRNLHDTSESLWVKNVLNYDNESQSRLVRMAGRISRAIMHPFQSLSDPSLPNLTRTKSWATAALIIVLVLTAFLARKRLMSCFGTGVVIPRRPKGIYGSYRRMERLLAKRGFRRRAWQTPWEFANTLKEAGWPDNEAVGTVTRTFCATRYGDQDVSPEETLRVEEALKHIKALPRQSSQKTDL